MEMSWKNMQVSMQIWTNYRSSCSRVTEWLFRKFWKFPKKATAVESYFGTVTGFAILFKQQSATNVFVKTFQIFITDIFYATPLDGFFWIYRQFL